MKEQKSKQNSFAHYATAITFHLYLNLTKYGGNYDFKANHVTYSLFLLF